MKKESTRPNWRIRVLESLDKMRPEVMTQISTNELQELYSIAYSFDVEQHQEDEENFEDNHEEEFPERKSNNESNPSETKLLTASVSYLSRKNSSFFPHHLQIIVPGANSTASASDRENFEVQIWERGLSQIFITNDLDFAFFEYANGEQPLIIDVFAIPADEEQSPYWRSTFEELPGNEEKGLMKIKKSIMKGIFPKDFGYIAVTWNGMGGYAKEYAFSLNPRQAVEEAVAALWEGKENPISSQELDQILHDFEWMKK